MKSISLTPIRCLIFVSIPLLFVAACGTLGGSSSMNSTSSDSKVKKFVDAFFKEKFFKQIDSERMAYEDLITKLKAKNINKSSVKNAYEETRIAYNAVLDMMNSDIQGMSNIAAFGFFDANKRYYDDLERARELGGNFHMLAGRELNIESAGVFENVFLIVAPLLKEIHDRSLAYCKQRMEARIIQSKFRAWSDI